MASVISVPANEGISAKNEHDDPEINAMALKMKENDQKNSTAAAKQQAASPENVYINRAGRAVTLTNPPINRYKRQENQYKLPNDCDDVDFKGRFSWEFIAGYRIPCIIRVINGEQLKFVSVRMIETKLLRYYLHYLHPVILTYTSVKSHYITESEAAVLNHINRNHAYCIYGNEVFFAGNDCIVRLEDAKEFYTFIEVCYEKIQCRMKNEKCGLLRIDNSECAMPYCIKDDIKYVPLFFFEGRKKHLKRRAVKLENWDLAYLKFCFKIIGIRNEFFPSDSCTAVNLDVLKNNFPPETNFEVFWPAKLFNKHLITNQKSTNVNPLGAWIRAPAKVVPAQNTIAQTLTAPASPLPPSMPVMKNTYQKICPANQMI